MHLILHTHANAIMLVLVWMQCAELFTYAHLMFLTHAHINDLPFTDSFE